MTARDTAAAAANTSKALAAWQELNERQQATLREIYALDQAAEKTRRGGGTRSQYAAGSASGQRTIDFALKSEKGHIRRDTYSTDLQNRLDAAGYDNQGNGSTMAALAARGLIQQADRPAVYGIMRTVALTREGRAAARAGTEMPATPKAPLGARSWEVLALLWEADTRGEVLRWKRSATIDNVLIGKYTPPLAERAGPGYRITARGRWFYRHHYAAHITAHPAVHAPHPDGPAAEPWPSAADEILRQHDTLYRALCLQWETARTDRDTARKEAAAKPPEVPGFLPEDITAQAISRWELWRDTARQRAALAARHTQHTETRARQAARSYALAALTAFQAAVTGSSPLSVLQPPGALPARDEPRLPPPAETGIPVIDDQARKLHAAATGIPPPRRGPPPARRRRSHYNRQPAAPDPSGSRLAALARFLHGHVSGGELTRRLHPAQPP